MNTPRKFVPILVAGVLGLGSLALLTAAWGEPGRGMGGPGPHSWYGGRMMHCNAQHAGPGFGPGAGHGWHGVGGADMLARRLGVMETEIGIRANQLDAWRDFTDALLGHGEAAIRSQRVDFSQRRQGAVRACATSRRQRDRPRQERPRFVEGGRCPAHQAHTRAAHQGGRARGPVPRASPLWAATRLPPVPRSWRQT